MITDARRVRSRLIALTAAALSLGDQGITARLLGSGASSKKQLLVGSLFKGLPHDCAPAALLLRLLA